MKAWELREWRKAQATVFAERITEKREMMCTTGSDASRQWQECAVGLKPEGNWMNGCTLKRWPPYFPLESALDRILEVYLFRNSIAQIKDIGIWTTSECLVLYHSLLEMQKLLQEKLTFRRAHIDLPQTITKWNNYRCVQLAKSSLVCFHCGYLSTQMSPSQRRLPRTFPVHFSFQLYGGMIDT